MKKSELLILALFFILASISIGYGFYYINKYGVNIPLDDQWDTIIPWTIKYYEGTFNPGILIEEQNDSRAVVTNTLLVGLSVLTKIDIKIIFYIGYLLYICSILIIIYLILKDLDIKKTIYILLLLPILFYAFNPFYLFRFIYNLGGISSLIILSAVLTFYFLDLSKRQCIPRNSYLFFTSSIILGFICTSSGAPGLSIWFAGFFQILLQKVNDKIRRLVIWMLGAGITFYYYYIAFGFKTTGIHGTEGYYAYFITALTYPLNKFLCFMGVLGAEVIHDPNIAFIFGAVILGTFILLLYNNKNSLKLDIYSKWYALLVFGTLTALELTLTRSGTLQFSIFGSPDQINFIPGIRHTLVSFLPLMCIYILALVYTKDPDNNNTQLNPNIPFIISKNEGNFLILGLVLMLMLCGTIFHILPGIAAAGQSHDENMNGEYYLLNYRTASDDQLKLLHPVPDRVRKYAPKLEQYKLGIFSNRTDISSILKLILVEPDKKIDTTGNNLKDGYYIKSSNTKIGNLSMPAIFEHPYGQGSILIYSNYLIPKNSHLEFYIGMDESSWDKDSSDGVTFEIHIAKKTTLSETTIFSKSINPAKDSKERSWQYQSIGLDNLSDELVDIKLITRPNNNPSYDAAWWGDPKLISLG